MARLSFQNVPTKTGGVISGNISIASGSPFGAGGEFAGKIAHVQAEIAKKPYGYYDPQESFQTQSTSIDYQLSQPTGSNNFTNERVERLEGSIGRNNSDARNNELRALVVEERQKERDAQADAHMQGVLARLQNGELVAPAYFQNNIIQVQTGVITSQQFLTVYQSFVKNGTIHKPIVVEKPIPVEIPTPTPTPTPTPAPSTPAVTSALPIIPIFIISAIVGIFLLRRRA